jgi:class 3 adenylate cyclase
VAREQRKLAAILAADVVGYSRLMGRDESGTLARLREHRKERLELEAAKAKSEATQARSGEMIPGSFRAVCAQYYDALHSRS